MICEHRTWTTVPSYASVQKDLFVLYRETTCTLAVNSNFNASCCQYRCVWLGIQVCAAVLLICLYKGVCGTAAVLFIFLYKGVCGCIINMLIFCVFIVVVPQVSLLSFFLFILLITLHICGCNWSVTNCCLSCDLLFW